MIIQAKFNIGDGVIHLQHGYRAIIVDVDPYFQASRSSKIDISQHSFAIRNPWYRLLVDKTNLMTYVEECFLKIDQTLIEIDNPQIPIFLHKYHGHYRLLKPVH